MPAAKKQVQAPAYEPQIEVRQTGFIVVPTATVFVDGVCFDKEVQLRHAALPNVGALGAYMSVHFQQQWDEFERTCTETLREQLMKQWSANGGEEA